MWIVTCDYINGVLTYFVENKETGERRGQFDCEPWAQEFADELNKGAEMTEREAKEIIRADPQGNIKQRMEALEVAEQILGKDYTMAQFWRWVDDTDQIRTIKD